MWHYNSYSTLLGVDAALEFNYSGDTIVNGKPCKKITGLFMGVNQNKYYHNTYTVVPNYSSFYTHESNGLLIVANGSGFDTIVNFQAKPGDAWYLKPSSCPHPNRWEVVDTSSVVINGFKLRRIVAKTFPVGVWTDDSVLVQIIERIYPFSFVTDFDFLRGHCYDGSAEFANTSFVCYKDDAFGTYSPAGGGCYKQVGTNDDSLTPVSAYGDANTGNLHVKVPGRGYILAVIDLYGRETIRTALMPGKSTVSTDNWLAGVYFCQIFHHRIGMYSRRIVIR